SCLIIALLMMRGVPARAQRDAQELVESGSRDDVSWHAALEGLRFVFRAPLIRSTMLLDFFATFFSSATALLPIFAQDILQVGASGYGWLYAAPAAGALVTSAALVPLTDRIEHRGQVLFMGGPQLGELEAGAVANWLGATFSVVSGGIGCLLATGWVALSTPSLR